MTDPGRWQRLARVAVAPADGVAFGVPRSCADCAHHECDRPPRFNGAWGARWSRCPHAEVRDDRHFQAAATIYAASLVSPLASWPMGWAAWVVEAVTAIKLASEARKAGGGGDQR